MAQSIIENLPDEILENIFSYCFGDKYWPAIANILNIGIVCKRFKRLLFSRELWRIIYSSLLLNINQTIPINSLWKNLLTPFKSRFSTNPPNWKNFIVNVEDEDYLYLENMQGQKITFDSTNFVCSETLLLGVHEKSFYKFDIDSFSFKKLNFTGNCPILISDFSLLKLVDIFPEHNRPFHVVYYSNEELDDQIMTFEIINDSLIVPLRYISAGEDVLDFTHNGYLFKNVNEWHFTGTNRAISCKGPTHGKNIYMINSLCRDVIIFVVEGKEDEEEDNVIIRNNNHGFRLKKPKNSDVRCFLGKFITIDDKIIDIYTGRYLHTITDKDIMQDAEIVHMTVEEDKYIVYYN